MTLIQLQQVQLAFGEHPILDHIDLTIDEGERLCIIGRNGVGKSSLIKLIANVVEPDDGHVWRSSGCRIGWLRQELPKVNDLTIAEFVAMGMGEVYQLRQRYQQLTQSSASPVEYRQLEQVSTRLDELQGWHMEQQVEAVLSRLNLSGCQTINKLSGGWRRRVALAQALVAQPQVLLLDEPTNHLDILTIEWLEQQLLEFNGALVFITHDRQFLRRVANRIVELDRGNLFSFPGDYNHFLAYRRQQLAEETRHNALFDRRLAQEEAWIRQGIKARRTRNEGRVRALETLRCQRQQRQEVQKQVAFEVAKADASGQQVCLLKGVSHGYDGRQLINNLDFILLRQDRVGLVGANGVGKSTLLNILLGQLVPDHGQVNLGTRLEIAYFDQLQEHLNLEKSVLDNVAEGRDSVVINGKQRHIISYLGDFLFNPQRVRSPVKSLSGGERNRLLLARLFSKPSNVLVLDEPTNDLDMETLELLEELLSQYPGTVLLVSHDRCFIDQVVTSCLVFEGQGKVSEHIGGYSDWQARGGRLGSQADRQSMADHGILTKTVAVKTLKSKKLSYKVQRELQQLPARIETLESQIASLQAEINGPDFYIGAHTHVTIRLEQLAQLEATLEQALERWVELEGDV